MRRGSKKPCPGCGKVDERRKASEVCRECKLLLRKAKWTEEQMSKLEEDEIVVAFGSQAHWNKYIYTRSRTGRELMDIFYRLAKAGSRPSVTCKSEFNLLGKIESGGTAYAVMPGPLAEAVRDLRVAVANALKLEYEQGKKDGHNLLMRLANGDLSMSDFDEKTGRG